MSVRLMTLVYAARFSLVFEGKTFTKKNGRAFRVTPAHVKSVAVALADHANDEGEGTYPSVEKLMLKVEMAKPTVTNCLAAMKAESVIWYVGRSRFNTSNYTMNVSKIVEMGKVESSPAVLSSADAVSPESSPAELSKVHPLNSKSSPAELKPSLRTKPPFAPVGAGAERTAKKGDVMDGILEAAKQAELLGEVEVRVRNFPADIQPILRKLQSQYGWPALAIPEPSKKKNGGDFGYWIESLNHIRAMTSPHTIRALDLAKEKCAKLTISKPDSIRWCLPAVMGEISKSQAAKDNALAPRAPIQTPFAKAMRTRALTNSDTKG